MRNQEKATTLPAEETALFCEQVSMVLKAGIPLYDGMETLMETYRGSRYGGQFEAIYQALLKNGGLGDAISETALFPAYMVGMVRIGEKAGKLDEIMDALASYYRWEAEVRVSVRNAILYPAVLVLMLAVVIAILLISVLPVFTRVFESLGISAGTGAGSLMRVGTGIGYGALILIGIALLVGLVFGILLRSRHSAGAVKVLYRLLPPVREAATRLSAGRFASVLSIMLVAGYPLGDAMEMAESVITDEAYQHKIVACARRMQEGVPFADAVANGGLFDPIHEKMIRFGSAAGQLDSVMAKLRDLYQEEADNAIQYLVSMIEPTLVTVLCIVIGGILLSVMLPLLSILTAIG